MDPSQYNRMATLKLLVFVFSYTYKTFTMRVGGLVNVNIAVCLVEGTYAGVGNGIAV